MTKPPAPCIGEVRFWQTASRYYRLASSYDLFGAIIITRHWGSLHNRRNGSKTQVFHDPHQAEYTLKRIISTRKYHGYQSPQYGQ